MTEIDRDEIVRLLQQLGEPDDSRVSAAARELSDRVNGAGLDWDDILILDLGRVGSVAEPTTAAGNADVLSLIEGLLARADVSDSTRDELSGYKEDIAAGEFTDDDLRYLQALAARL